MPQHLPADGARIGDWEPPQRHIGAAVVQSDGRAVPVDLPDPELPAGPALGERAFDGRQQPPSHAGGDPDPQRGHRRGDSNLDRLDELLPPGSAAGDR